MDILNNDEHWLSRRQAIELAAKNTTNVISLRFCGLAQDGTAACGDPNFNRVINYPSTGVV